MPFAIPRFLFRLALGRRLPRTSGVLAVPGLDGPVRIRRDAWGIPYIEAGSAADAWFGLGFCQGQDRAFQLESLLRAVRGTLAALVGREGLALDRLSRRIGFRRAAEAQLRASDPELRRSVEAFARGVTAGGSAGSPRRAHEFVLLRSRPTPYTAADAIGVLGVVSFALASNWDAELMRLRILENDGPEALRAIDPAYPGWLPVTSPPGAAAGAAADRLAADLAALGAHVRAGGGSNNWALAPGRTASGRPLLANDPHLPPVLPPTWYLAHLRTPGWTVAGASFAGAPGIAVGHGDFAAWGVTAGLTDNADLFLEEVGPDGRSVRQGSGFVPCERREERIEVRGEGEVVEEVLVTPRGPIVSPALGGEARALSLRAVWLLPLPIEGTLRAPSARSFEEFRAPLARWPLLPTNHVYADVRGAIGWQLAGQAPRRRKGCGLLPLAGWDEEAGWEEELLPFADLPHVADPPCGFVASANNRPERDGGGAFLGADWADGYRLARICEALGARADWDVRALLRLQLDQESLPWREMRTFVLGIPEHASLEPAARRALEVLAAWDGKVAADSAAAAVFELFTAEMCRRVAEARAPRSVESVLGRLANPFGEYYSFSLRRVGHLVRLLREQPAGWFARSWAEEAAAALAAAARRLEDAFRGDLARAAWGRLRTLTFEHPFGRERLFARIFNRGPYPSGGDANTLAQASVNPLEPEANPLFVASLRAVMDVGRFGESRFILPGGQSGNPLSPHYDDQMPLYLAGEGIAMAWSEEEVDRAAVATLRLEPLPQV